MNRLILIGNGFDLAHGLKTSYKDFIFWYLDECFKRAGIYANSQPHEDEFLHISVLEHYKLADLYNLSGQKGLSKYLYEQGLLEPYLSFDPNKQYGAKSNIEKYSKVSGLTAHRVSYKSLFFKRLTDACLECGWVDIEQEYFDALKKYNDGNKAHDLDYLRRINKDFEFLKSKLEEYLTTEDGSGIEIHNKLLSALISDFKTDDFDTLLDKESLIQGQLWDITNERNNDKAYVLNFNYTNTFKTYLDAIYEHKRYLSVKENHIHGQLNNPDNPIIFGFGDEHDTAYTQFEEQRNNDLFAHIKSYFYMQTPNYRNLIRFLNEGHFQVLVIGHSCGLSDRTMFKEVFDHENCKSVKIYHYTDDSGKNDFFDKTINLGRHFSDKGRMRKLIVEFNPADAIPQKCGEQIFNIP
ncbi:AbiH family protein [Sphingobacterium phlebotomi]|uniref:AbiH family protein n=1 Tax=Sphingobacterium phlebotomi TaxID=2605433 RepID=UPI001CA37B65|nr:AbiH family protein [Sphingobacterium phlebotomi]